MQSAECRPKPTPTPLSSTTSTQNPQKPKTLEEAVDKLAAVMIEEEKAKLESALAAKYEALLARIAHLEAVAAAAAAAAAAGGTGARRSQTGSAGGKRQQQQQ